MSVKILSSVLLVSALSGCAWSQVKPVQVETVGKPKTPLNLKDPETVKTRKAKELECSTIVKQTGSICNITTNQAKEIKAFGDKSNVKANGQSRDLGNIAGVKPNIIQGNVNKATDNIDRCFEIIAGSPIKEGEVLNECKDFIRRAPR